MILRVIHFLLLGLWLIPNFWRHPLNPLNGIVSFLPRLIFCFREYVRIKTRLNLVRWGIDIGSVLCTIVAMMLRSSTTFYFLVVWQWIDGVFCPDGGRWICQCLEVVVNTMFWTLWSFRNRLLFAKEEPLKVLIWDLTQSQIFFWINSKCFKFRIKWVDWVKNVFCNHLMYFFFYSFC